MSEIHDCMLGLTVDEKGNGIAMDCKRKIEGIGRVK